MKDIKQEILAKNWAKLTLAQADEGELFEDGEIAAAKILNEALDPPTLLGALFEPLVGVITCMGSEVITLSERYAGVIDCYYPGSGTIFPISAADLYPNGKKYKIVEDGATVSQDEKVAGDKPKRPEVLTSCDDYSGAPSGTVAVASNSLPLVKMRNGEWVTGVSKYPVKHIAGTTRKVVRWGWKL